MHEIAVEKILQYIENAYPVPETWLPKELFKHRSCERWAAYDILNLVMDHPLDSPEIIVEGYLLRMIAYMHDSTAHPTIFRIAKDVAEDILEIL